MSSHEEYILRILSEATDPLFPSEITERLNREISHGSAYTAMAIAARLQGLDRQLAQLPDGRWTLKQRVA